MITEDFQIFLNEDLLLNSGLDLKQTYGLTLPISYETARVWMQSLGFSFSDFKKGIYNDGHDHEDNVQHRINLIGRSFDWQDVSKGIPGYSSRANHFVHFLKQSRCQTIVWFVRC